MVLQTEEDNEEIIEENVIKQHIHKKNQNGAMLNADLGNSMIQDGADKGFVQDGADKGFVQDGADKGFINADLTGGNSSSNNQQEIEKEKKEEQIAQNEKTISKTKMKVKALDITIEDIDAKILAKLKKINELNKRKFANAGDDEKFKEIVAEKRKEEKKLEILKQQKEKMLGKIKTAKNDNFNLKKSSS